MKRIKSASSFVIEESLKDMDSVFDSSTNLSAPAAFNGVRIINNTKSFPPIFAEFCEIKDESWRDSKKIIEFSRKEVKMHKVGKAYKSFRSLLRDLEKSNDSY